ncbi:MAG: ROK family protein [Candidatus Omnitrophota bacterium]
MIAKNKIQFTPHPTNDREKKNLLFLNLIKKKKSTSRTELSKITDINVVTVSNYINSYLKKGFVLERGHDISSGGRRPELVEINREHGCVIGIDMDGNNAKGVITDFGMEVLNSESIDGCDKEDKRAVVKKITDRLIAASKIDRKLVKKIGISAMQGAVMQEVAEVSREIGNDMGIPVLVGERALCAAFGEKNSNPIAKDISGILYVHTDIGQAVYLRDDEFYEATEQKEGCAYLRAWDSGLGVANEAKRLVESGVGTKIADLARTDPKNITLEIVINAAKDQDEVAIDLLRTSGMSLGVRIAYLINLLSPEIAIIGGGIEEAQDIFLSPLIASAMRFVLQRLVDKITIEPAVLGKEKTCARGAAFLSIRETFIEA